MRQSCKKCGVRDGLNFYVPDRLWARAIPKKYAQSALCLTCFDTFAARRGVEYHRSLRVLYFAGRQACFQFRVVRAARSL